MKSFKAYISEAVATRKNPTSAEKKQFADKFDQVVDSPEYARLRRKKRSVRWHLTGHNPTRHGTNKEVEAVKQKVFGKRRKGTSDLLWMHNEHGLITHPAVGDITHSDVDHYFGKEKRKGIKVNKKIQAKVQTGGTDAINGTGRIEHHEGGGGIISYHHIGTGSRAAAVRTIARQYPKHKIHDGFGNLLENDSESLDVVVEAVATKRKKPTRKQKADFADKFDRVKNSSAFSDSQSKRYTSPWHLTGHNTTRHGTTKAIEAVKQKVFGKRRKGTSDLLWMHHKHGVITHPAVGDITHADVQEKPRKGIRVKKRIQAKIKEDGVGAILGHGRIEHHEGGGGIISYHHLWGSATPRSAAVRTIARQYPKYKIHDGEGHLLESMKKKWKKLLSSPEWQKAPGNMTQWQLTGHNPGTKRGTTHEIEKAKERVFGKRQGNSDLFWLHSHHGVVTHPAVGDITHTDVDGPSWKGSLHRKRKGIKVDKKIQKKVNEGGSGSHWGLGRIEHHEGGGGIISYHHKGGVSKSAAVRMISRQYPKYQIHDGQGNLLENWSYAHDFDDMPNSEKQKYVYHVTTAARAAKIVKHGLKPRSPKGRTNYPGNKEHTQGQAFVTNHQGVRYWKDQTLHAVNRRKREVDERDAENIHVIKFPIANLKKSTRRKLRIDPLGTKDARKRDDDPMIDPSSHEGSTALMLRKKIRESWSERYKRSIDCNNPKGFSQRAHCQGRKKLDEVANVQSFKSFINEQTEERIKDFVDFASDYLGLKQDPDIEFVDQREDGMTTACYSPSECKIKIYKGSRATFDICRSIAHEMVHQMQDENGDELDGTTGSPCEDEANALAGRMIRVYGSNKEGFYEE